MSQHSLISDAFKKARKASAYLFMTGLYVIQPVSNFLFRLNKIQKITILLFFPISGGILYYAFINAQPDEAIITIRPEVKSIEKVIDVSGIVVPSEQINIGTQATGNIKHVYTHLGETVTKGQLLAVVDNQIQAGTVFNAKITLQSIQNQIHQKYIAINQNKLDIQRSEILLKTDAISKNEIENYINTKKNLQLELNSLNLQLKQAENEVKKAEASLDSYNIYAPTNGKIVAILGKEGQTVVSSQSATPIFILANISKIRIKLKIPESIVDSLFVNQMVMFKSSSSKEYQDGRINEIEPIPDIIANNPQQSTLSVDGNPIFYSTYINTDNKMGRYKIGMTVEAKIITDKSYKALTIPIAALNKKLEDNSYEVSVLENDKPVARTIKTGITNGIDITIKSGLTPQDQVIVNTNTSKDNGSDA